MKETQTKKNKNNFITILIVLIFLIIIIINCTGWLTQSRDVFVVTNGSLSYEELTEGYIIRDETVLVGENYKNGMVQILSDGERASHSEMVFRYHSNNEEKILSEISKLDEEINEIIENTGKPVVSSDISSLEKQIETTINSMYNLNYLQKINENKNKIETYISKKTQITERLSPEDSYLKTLINQRSVLEKQIQSDSEIVYAKNAGMVSYRVDGLEEILVANNFDYLTTEKLDGFELKVGATVPLSNEKGKIVNNFVCYIATSIDTEKAMTANVGDKVTLRLSNLNEIDAKIIKIIEENQNRILVFEIKDDVAELLEYRKISFDIIWWKYTGLKVSNDSLLEENDITYVEKERAGYTDKIYVKVLRQNDSYSIVENYEDEELIELGISKNEIENMKKIKVYDEILLH